MTPPMSASEIWESVCRQIAPTIPATALEVWFEPAVCSMPDTDHFEVHVPTLTTRNVLDYRYRGEIGDCVRELVGHPCEVRIEVTDPGR